MKTIFKARYAETLLYALSGGVLLALAGFSLQQRTAHATDRAEIVAATLAGYGGLLLLFAFVSLYYTRKGVSFGALVKAQARATFALLREIGAFLAERCSQRLDLFGLLLAALIGVGLRAFFLDQPMRMDESYTFLYYLNRGRDPFYYVIPNNHVLHSLLAWLSVSLWGMGPAAIRLPAFLAGVLSIPLVFLLCKAFNKNAGLLAALGTAVFPYLVLYSSMARGYALIVLLTLMLLVVGKYYLERPSIPGCILISVISALGLLTMPTMAFTLAGFYLWLGLALFVKERNTLTLLRDFLLPCVLMTALLTVVFYTPTVISSNGAQAIFSNQFVDARSWADFSKRLLPHYQQTLSDFSRDIPRLVEYTGLLLGAIGLFSVLRGRNWAAVLLLPSMLLGGLLVLFAKQAIPFARTWIYLIPFTLLFADLGYTSLVEKLQPGLRVALTALVFTAGCLLAGKLISSNAIAGYKDTGSFPEASVVARYLKPLMTGDEFIVVRDTANYSTFYYLCYDGAPPQKKDIDPGSAKRYFVVQKSWYALKDLTDEPATPLFEYGDAVIYISTGGKRPLFPAFVFDCWNP